MSEKPVVQVSTMPEVVASIPALIGFHPSESLVLLCLGGESGSQFQGALQMDLPRMDDSIGDWLDTLVTGCVNAADVATSVVVVLVTARPMPELQGFLRGFFNEVMAWRVVQEIHTEHTRPGAAWTCSADDDCGMAGILPDVITDAQVTMAVKGGMQVFSDRDAWERAGSPAHPDPRPGR